MLSFHLQKDGLQSFAQILPLEQKAFPQINAVDLSKYLKWSSVLTTVLERETSRYFPTPNCVFMFVLEIEQERGLQHLPVRLKAWCTSVFLVLVWWKWVCLVSYNANAIVESDSLQYYEMAQSASFNLTTWSQQACQPKNSLISSLVQFCASLLLISLPKQIFRYIFYSSCSWTKKKLLWTALEGYSKFKVTQEELLLVSSNQVLWTKGMYLSIENWFCNFNDEMKWKYSGLLFAF